MDSFSDIKSIWQANTFNDLPHIGAIEEAIGQFNKKIKLKNLLAIILLGVMIITLCFLISLALFKLWTTYLGLFIFMGVAFYTVYLKIKRHSKFSHLETLPNNDFLFALEKESEQACIGKSKHRTLLFIVWVIGFSFYLYEFISTDINYLLLGYSVLLILCLVMWFVYRPWMTKRYQNNVRMTIDHINHLKSQANYDY